MTDEKYLGYVEQYLKNYKIRNVSIYPDLVRVDMVPGKDWATCTFIFTQHHIACFGDVSAYTWNVTWNAAEQIKKGNCNASNFGYLAGKLEHSHELKTFEFSYEVMNKIKNYLTEDMSDNKKTEFNKKWDYNYYLLLSVDKYRLNGLDEFFNEMNVSDAYEFYSWFEDYPPHYYLAVAMLRCIEHYFKNQEEKII